MRKQVFALNKLQPHIPIMKLFAKRASTSEPVFRNGYSLRPIQDCVPGSWVSKTRLNGIAITSGRRTAPSGGIIVFPTDASVQQGFWDHLREWSSGGVGPGHHRARVGRLLKGRFQTDCERFDENSVCLEIDKVNDEELVEITAMIARELYQAEVVVKSAATPRIWLFAATKSGNPLPLS